ncbi:Holliday junction branch migration protein RuvA [Candidatus Uhrbacteria bacterium]|nr:Holliday junction branch migration protein RuvA [Candidatus Uhrbacteria bacterium]
MIVTLTGKVTHRLDGAVILETGGIGYEVSVTPAVLSGAAVGQVVSLWIHEHRREDALDLFGLSSLEELGIYRRLVGVSGVGPKMALHIMALGPVSEIEAIIDRGDIEMITRVKGIGRKTAQKIILELKGKLVHSKGQDSSLDEVVAALVNMGVDRQVAREAAASAAKTERTVEGQLKSALRQLGR